MLMTIFSAFFLFFMNGEQRQSVRHKTSEKNFQVHFIHKPIKEVPFISSREAGYWNHKLFMAFLIFFGLEKHPQVHDTWSQAYL